MAAKKTGMQEVTENIDATTKNWMLKIFEGSSIRGCFESNIIRNAS